jgi:hypothetical protein
VVRVGNTTSTTLTLNTGAPQGCVLSSLLYSLIPNYYLPTHNSNTIIKFADDTTVVGLITDDDETAYREEVNDLAVWCQDNNLSLNVGKTKELIVDYRKRRCEHAPNPHQRAIVEWVGIFKFLGVHITSINMAHTQLLPLNQSCMSISRKTKVLKAGPKIVYKRLNKRFCCDSYVDDVKNIYWSDVINEEHPDAALDEIYEIAPSNY